MDLDVSMVLSHRRGEALAYHALLICVTNVTTLIVSLEPGLEPKSLRTPRKPQDAPKRPQDVPRLSGGNPRSPPGRPRILKKPPRIPWEVS